MNFISSCTGLCCDPRGDSHEALQDLTHMTAQQVVA